MSPAPGATPLPEAAPAAPSSAPAGRSAEHPLRHRLLGWAEAYALQALSS